MARRVCFVLLRFAKPRRESQQGCYMGIMLSSREGGDIDWLGKKDEEIIAETMLELERLFPTDRDLGLGQ
eukprot:1801748-Amphidinium_carterae.1